MKLIKFRGIHAGNFSNKNNLQDNLTSIRDNLKAADEKLNKNIILIIFLLLLYIIMLDPSFTEIKFSFIEINNPLIIRTLLPLAIAYNFRELCAISYMRERIRRKHEELFFKTNNNKCLESYTIPISFLSVHEIIAKKYRNSFILIFLLIGSSIDVLLLLTITLFPANMVQDNLISEHLKITIIKTIDITMISAVFTVLLWLSGFILFIITEKEKLAALNIKSKNEQFEIMNRKKLGGDKYEKN